MANRKWTCDDRNPWGIEQMDIKVGSPSVPIPGFEIDVLDDKGNILPPNQLGSIAIKLPLAPGALPSLWKADEVSLGVLVKISWVLRNR